MGQSHLRRLSALLFSLTNAFFASHPAFRFSLRACLIDPGGLGGRFPPLTAPTSPSPSRPISEASAPSSSTCPVGVGVGAIADAAGADAGADPPWPTSDVVFASLSSSSCFVGVGVGTGASASADAVADGVVDADAAAVVDAPPAALTALSRSVGGCCCRHSASLAGFSVSVLLPTFLAASVEAGRSSCVWCGIPTAAVVIAVVLLAVVLLAVKQHST